MANDPEALHLAVLLSRIFDVINARHPNAWRMDTLPISYSHSLVGDLRISGAPSATLDLARRAFAAAGVAFTIDGLPPAVFQLNTITTTLDPPQTNVGIMIGSKRLP